MDCEVEVRAENYSSSTIRPLPQNWFTGLACVPIYPESEGVSDSILNPGANNPVTTVYFLYLVPFRGALCKLNLYIYIPFQK
jgi:hypothetical protein